METSALLLTFFSQVSIGLLFFMMLILMLVDVIDANELVIFQKSKQHELHLTIMTKVELFDLWAIDFMGPSVLSFNNQYILVAVDYVSK